MAIRNVAYHTQLDVEVTGLSPWNWGLVVLSSCDVAIYSSLLSKAFKDFSRTLDLYHKG